MEARGTAVGLVLKREKVTVGGAVYVVSTTWPEMVVVTVYPPAAGGAVGAVPVAEEEEEELELELELEVAAAATGGGA
jgi:hypothetical protein